MFPNSGVWPDLNTVWTEMFLRFSHCTSCFKILKPGLSLESPCSEVPYIAKTIFTLCLANFKLLTLSPVNLWRKALVLFSEGQKSKLKQMHLLILINWAQSDINSKQELLKCRHWPWSFPRLPCVCPSAVIQRSLSPGMSTPTLESKWRVEWHKLLLPSPSFSPEELLLAGYTVSAEMCSSAECGLWSCQPRTSLAFFTWFL